MSSPAVHSVHFYDHDEALISRLQNIVASSLEGGSSVLIVATKEHRRQLQSALQESGVALSELPAGQLQMLDAGATLAHFMVHGRPNAQRFIESVGLLISNARQAALNSARGLTVFGEMVAVLWGEGNKIGALELERLWNDLLHDRTFHLHCAYPRWVLQDNISNLTIKSICDEHSSVLGFASHLTPSAA
jgi:MEDS: MEthanogen/methylotroph, DcmR Sensory domain